MIKQAMNELVAKLRAANSSQVARVSGLGESTLTNIRASGAIRNVSTAVILEETMEILARDPHRGELKRGRKSRQ